ncbi:mRNA-decapping enzyme subunit 2 [Spathaspora sp. JA1]|nr:mRNA-decapping enzyme subunit 2 [Spathaspora sp. JA1]
MSIQLRDGLSDQPLDRVLDDLLVRFVVNVPQEDLSSIERMFFQVEEAQWFYSDFIRQQNPSLPPMKMKTFSAEILEKCPLIWKWGDPDDALSRFGKYKSTIPVRGVALLNHDLTEVVLVKGTESNAWSFPRGKISKGESDIECAIREVEEETGYNCRGLINEYDFIERTIRGKNYKIYLVKNVDESTEFSPISRFEISKIQWHDIKSLQKNCAKNPNNYFIVGTVLKPMLRWISKNKSNVTDEELMLRVEVKLKRLLGLDKEDKLVDIVKKSSNTATAATSATNSVHAVNIGTPQPVVPLPIPQPFPMFGLPPVPPPYPVYNNIPGPQPYHIAMTPLVAPPPQQQSQVQSFTQERNYLTPNPQTLVKPTIKSGSTANSKELLSLLTTKKTDKLIPETQNENVKQAILGALNVNVKPNPSNELEESLQKTATNAPAKKVTLLKRERPTKNKKSIELMSMLGSSKPKNDTASTSSPPPQQSAGAELLGILNKAISSNPQSPPTKITSPGAELLGILNKTKSPVSPDLEETLEFSNQNEFAKLTKQPTFEDFEDFNSGYDQPSQGQGFRNFDIASDEEDLDHLIDPIVTTSETRGFFPSPPPPAKPKIRILKRNEQQDATNGGAAPAAGTNAEGQGLLALLKGGSAGSNPISLGNTTNPIKSDSHKRSADFLKDLLKR